MHEIDGFVAGATDGSWPDYQLSALLMAIVLRGMSDEETAWLTEAMARSGTRFDLRGCRAARSTSTARAASATRRRWSWRRWRPPAAWSCR